MSFWDFTPTDKWDEIKEERVRHQKLLTDALSDPITGIEEFQPDEYILYGKEEALLYRPQEFIHRLLMKLAFCVFLVIPNNQQ